MIKIDSITKTFKNGDETFYALNNISVEIPENKITIISGPSGSGKSTLLSIIGLLQTPTSGELYFDDDLIDFAKASNLRQTIKDNISYVFQEFNLIDDFSVEDNLLMVCNDLTTIDQILETIGLSNKKTTATKLLSGGEKQRLSIGRAIAKGGKIILLDEPTGNLDADNGKIIFELLKKFSKNKTIIVVTHDLKLAYNYADFVVLLESGKIESTFSMTQKSFELDFKNNGIDAFMLYSDAIRYKATENEITLKIICEEKQKDYIVDNVNLLSVFNNIYKDFKNEIVSVQIIEKESVKKAGRSLNDVSNSKSVFPFKYTVKYSKSLFKNKLGRNIASIVLLILNIIMIFVYTNIAAFDCVGATQNAFLENNAYFAQPYILARNEVTSRENPYYSGKSLYSALDNADFDALPMLRVATDASNLDMSLVIIDKDIKFRDATIAVPAEDSIVVTDFVSSLLIDKQIINIESDDINVNLSFEDYSLNVSSVVECDYDEQLRLNFINDSSYQNDTSYSDLFINEYSLGFISSETFMNIKKNAEFSELHASNFFLSKSMTRTYADITTTYCTYDENVNLTLGQAPQEDFEVVISETVFTRVQYFANLQNMTLEDCIGQEFEYKDLNSSPNKVLYQTYMNLYDITKKVKIVGVTSDVYTETVYVSDAFADLMRKEQDMYLSSFLIDVASGFANMGKLDASNVFYDFSYLQPILQMRGIINSDFFYIVLGAIGIVLVSTITFLVLTFVMNVKEKYKEIAILKSFGTSRNNIAGLFFILNYFIAIVSIILGLSLAILALFFINQVFMSPSVFNINYAIINLSPISFLIVILITLFAALISTLFALRKVDKIDVALALKMY